MMSLMRMTINQEIMERRFYERQYDNSDMEALEECKEIQF